MATQADLAPRGNGRARSDGSWLVGARAQGIAPRVITGVESAAPGARGLTRKTRRRAASPCASFDLGCSQTLRPEGSDITHGPHAHRLTPARSPCLPREGLREFAVSPATFEPFTLARRSHVCGVATIGGREARRMRTGQKGVHHERNDDREGRRKGKAD